MRVTTIDGGFRGLGSTSPTPAQIVAAQDPLDKAFEAALDAMDLANRAAIARRLSAEELSTLRTQLDVLSASYDERIARLSSVSTRAALLEWTSRTEALVASLAAFRARAARAAGESTLLEPWKIGVAVAGGLLLVGAIAYATART